jgi:hypothetical protein
VCRLQDAAGELGAATAPLLQPCAAEAPLLMPPQPQPPAADDASQGGSAGADLPLQQPLPASEESPTASASRAAAAAAAAASSQQQQQLALAVTLGAEGDEDEYGAVRDFRAAQAAVITSRLAALRPAAAASEMGLPAAQAAHSLLRSGVVSKRQDLTQVRTG